MTRKAVGRWVPKNIMIEEMETWKKARTWSEVKQESPKRIPSAEFRPSSYIFVDVDAPFWVGADERRTIFRICE